MRCYFLRHGLAAEPGEWNGTDFDRPLTGAGRERMAREAQTMAGLSLDLDIILTSPLVRAKQTAEIVATELKMRERLREDRRLGGEFGPNHMAAILKDHSSAKAILLVGHEPGMSQTVGHLIGAARIDFKKGALARVDLLDPSSFKGALVWLIPPKLLATGRTSHPV